MTGPLESQYGPVVDAAADAAGIPRAALRAIVWVESNWDPNAFLAEQGGAGSGSYGLTQVTLDTARGLGFSGDPSRLFDPLTNANLGARIFAGALKNAEQAAPDADPVTWLQMAASAYNGGYRPSLGFGFPVTEQTTVCLRTDPVSGACLQTFTALPGQYGNQQYVDNFTAYFQQEGGDVGGLQTAIESLAPIEIDSNGADGAGGALPVSGAALGLSAVAWLAIAAVAGVGYMIYRHKVTE